MSPPPFDPYAESRRHKLFVECVAAIDLGRALPDDAALCRLMHGCTPAQLEAAFSELRQDGQLQASRLANGKRRARILQDGAWSAWSPVGGAAVAVAAE